MEKHKSLTPRETEVFINLALGKSHQEIAKVMNISHRTVAVHVASIYRKLEMKNAQQATIYAIKNKLIKL